MRSWIRGAIAFAIVVCLPQIASSQDARNCPGDVRVLATGGGGIRGAYQVGAAWYLVKVRRCYFHHFVGTSTGALTAAVLASSRDPADLESKVELLVDVYKGLTKQSDVVKTNQLLSLRGLLLPSTGGVQGLSSLEPLLARISAAKIDLNSIPRAKLSVPVVSLQSGRIDQDTIMSTADLIIGSASIPLFIEPRRARVWSNGWAYRNEGDVIRIRSTQAPGLRDPNCELDLIDGGPTHKCRYIERRALKHETTSGRITDDESSVDWEVALEVPKLPVQVRKHLSNTLPQDRGAEDPPFSQFAGGRQLRQVRFSSIHELVDGGAVDNLAIRHAIDVWAEGRGPDPRLGPYDSIFVLGTGTNIPELPGDVQASAAWAVATSTFETLWERYQADARERGLAYISGLELASEARRVSAASTKRERALTGMLTTQQLANLKEQAPPPDLARLRKLTGQIRNEQFFRESGFRQPPANVRLFILNPRRSVFTRTLEVDPSKIHAAIYDGCLMAAAFDFETANNSETEQITGMEPDPDCDPLRPTG